MPAPFSHQLAQQPEGSYPYSPWYQKYGNYRYDSDGNIIVGPPTATQDQPVPMGEDAADTGGAEA